MGGPLVRVRPHTYGGHIMSASIVARSESSFTVQVEIPYGSSMLDFEQTIQERLNQAGVVATQEALQQFDTDGSPITVGSVKFTSKGQLPKEYQTPYGVATVARPVYQSPQGGQTHCPPDRAARPRPPPQGVPAALRRRPRRPPRLPEPARRQDLLPARPRCPDRHQFHPTVRQDDRPQVCRVRIGSGPH